MQFLNPLYLIGLIAASVPIIIHLLIVRKNKIIEFSTLRFLNALEKTQIRRLRLKQLLLLILRTALIIFIVLAFARPTIKSKLPALSNYSNISVVLIIDNSISMDVSDEYGNRYRQVKKLAQSIVDHLTDGDEVSLIFTTDNQHPLGFTQNLAVIRENIARSSISLFPSSFETAFRFAQKELQEAKHFARQIFIISDFQNSSLRGFKDSIRYFDENTQVNLLPIGINSKIEIQNISIDSIISISKIFERGKFCEFEAVLHNRSKRSYQNLVLSLFYNDERVAQRSVDLKPMEIKNVAIGAEATKFGPIECRFEIETDAFDYDNRRWIGFIVPTPPEVVLLTTNANSVLSKFLTDVLAERISLKKLSPSEFLKSDLQEASVLIIETTEFENQTWTKIAEFVGSGRGVLLFPDANASPQSLKNGFSIMEIGANFEIKTFPSTNTAMITKVDKEHPLLAGVYKRTEGKVTEIFDGPKISRAMFVNVGEPIIETNAGNLFTEIKTQGGRIIYSSITASNDWSNFPLTSLFPVVIYRSILYLNAVGDLNYFAYCGEPFTIILPKFLNPVSNFSIEDPLGSKNYLQSVVLPSGVTLQVNELVGTGVYKIATAESKPIGTISVNLDPKEFDLQLSTRKDINNYFSSKVKKGVELRYIQDFSKIDKAELRTFVGTELCRLFILLAILCALLEMAIAQTTKNELSKVKG
ncbi:MAG: BatA domain-containing protein [Candidatus Kapaibacteriales bacterium]